jgi:hypothetical protein
MKTTERPESWSGLVLLIFLAAYLLVFSEWLFAVTKPSFLNALTFAQQLRVFLAAAALVTALVILCLSPLAILGVLPRVKPYVHRLIQTGGFLPAALFAILILLMVDNFTYTLWGVGILSSEGWHRALYGAGFVLLVGVCYWRVLDATHSLGRRIRAWRLSPAGVFGVLAGIVLVLVFPIWPDASSPAIAGADAERRPHVVMITADGVDANHTSLYGYARDTTPRLRQLAESALVAENAFTNSESTTGSLVSMYTGKSPARTRLFAVPDVLRGRDAHEHLPGILRSMGYRAIQIGVPNFLDANLQNVRDGFDEVRVSSAAQQSKYLDVIRRALPDDRALFVDETFKRVVDRVRHILFIQKAVNPYLLVTTMPALTVDVERWEILRHEIRAARQPLFVHIHAMITHGKTFNPPEQRFSAGQVVKEQTPWDINFYDDSILDVDKNIGRVVDELTALGRLDNTLLIITSDHGHREDKQIKRLPLLLRFPHGQYAGRIRANVQGLDIAPTVLDYMGVEHPEWMSGQSLIKRRLGEKPIFGTSSYRAAGVVANDVVTLVTLIYCGRWFKLDVIETRLESGAVQGSTSACRSSKEITDDEAVQLMVEHLEENGIDASGVKTVLRPLPLGSAPP